MKTISHLTVGSDTWSLRSPSAGANAAMAVSAMRPKENFGATTGYDRRPLSLPGRSSP